MTSLTAEQKRAVVSSAHALEVRAGAGTGKTTTLAHRLARLAQEGIAEHRMLAVTFTRDATAALTRKLGILLGKGHGVRVSSFHQWAARELASEEPRYLSQDDARRIVLRQFQRAPASLGLSFALGAGADGDVGARALGFLSYVKNAETSVGDAIERQFPALAPWMGDLEALMESYQEAKGARLDYDDLLLLFRDRSRTSPSFRREISGRIDHLAVDEYQDVNRAQADLVRALTAPRGVPVTVVGDPRQRIYGFRGAGDHLSRFLDAYGERGERVPLTISFRSTRAIVDAGNALLPDSHPLRPRPRAPQGLAVRAEAFPDMLAEARFVADHVEGLLAKGAQPEDCAVLARTRGLASRYVDEARDRDGLAKVRLSTIHAAKGLEWDHVVLLGAREGGLPSSHALRGSPAALPTLLAEERRLLYVAATRARKSLLVTWPGAPSRFLAPILARETAPTLGEKGMKKFAAPKGRAVSV